MFERRLEVVTGDDASKQEEVKEVLVEQEFEGAEAVVVWDAALVLAYFLQRHQKELALKGKRVIELGAGTGVVGLVVAALGADVLLTDLPEFVPLLRSNAALNACLFSAEAAALTWGEPDPAIVEQRRFDLVLVSDCIYYEASLDPLVNTLVRLSEANAGVTILVSYEDRSASSAEKQRVQERFLELVKSAGFSARQYPTSECHPDYASDDIHVLGLQKKQLH